MIDYVCTWGPAIHGHDHPIIREAIAQSLSNGTSFGTPGPAEVEMAELIVELVPSVEKLGCVTVGRKQLCRQYDWLVDLPTVTRL